MTTQRLHLTTQRLHLTTQRLQFAKGCFLFLALGTIPIIFMNFTGYIAGLGFIGLISIALAHILV